MLFLEGKNGWRRHPFTMSGAPHDGVLRFTIKSLGDDTAAEPGRLSVFLCGPRGMVHTFTRALRRAGVAPRNLHREHFDWR